MPNPSDLLTLIPRGIIWMKRREKWVLLTAAVFQILVLVGMFFRHATPLFAGETMLVRVVPVDPRDLLRGDYVVLSYEFSRWNINSIEGLPPYAWSDWRALEGRPVYVTMVPEADGRHWRHDKATIHPPRSGRFLKGQLRGNGQLELGIESYFVQEGKGRQYEDAVRTRKLSAEIAVAPGGQAMLRSLIIEP